MIYNTGETDEQLKENYNPDGSMLRKAQMRMLDMLDYIDVICQQNGFQYCLMFGTCLGAVRHKGFIPWDDDLDIYMARKDWKKLVSYLKKNPHPQYKIQTHETDKGYMGAWAVLRDTKSEYIQDSTIHNVRKYKGMQIDLFPYDKGNIYKLQSLSSRLARRLVESNIIRGRLNLANLCWLSLFKFVFPIFRLLNVFGDQKRVSFSYGTYWFDKGRYYIKIKELLPYKPIEYEGKFYPGPNSPTAILKQVYGNFMELPPCNARNHHEADYKIWD